MRPDTVFLSAVSAGCFLSFGAAASLGAFTAPWFQVSAPSLLRMVGAMVCPLGLVSEVLTGADLFTATTMVSREEIYPYHLVTDSTCQYTTVAAFYGRLLVKKKQQHKNLSFRGNLAGSLFVRGPGY